MSQIWEYIKIAIMNIKNNKGRSILTMLGIIIGIAGLILMQTGGLKSLQTVSIVFAFPFSFVVALMPFSAMKMLKKDLPNKNHFG